MPTAKNTPPTKAETVVAEAHKLYGSRPTWAEFHQQVLGVHGLVAKAFPDPVDRLAFRESAKGREIDWMLRRLDVGQLRHRDIAVVFVRVPRTLRDALGEEAKDRGRSINRLCVDKLAGRPTPIEPEIQTAADEPPRERLWKGEYTIRAGTTGRVVKTSSVELRAKTKRMARAAAARWVRDNDEHCDDRLDPIVEITKLERVVVGKR